MPVDWKAPDSFNRLLAATVASMDGHMKLNYKRIADFYGEGATYDAIEGRFRLIKKQAAKLKEEVENGRPIAPNRGGGSGGGSGSNQSTPRKPRANKANNSQEGVLTGRVQKATASPTKKRSTQIKVEPVDSSTSASTSSATDDANTPSSSVNYGSGSIIEDSFYDPTFGSFELGLNAGPNHGIGVVNPISFGGPDTDLSLDTFWTDDHVV